MKTNNYANQDTEETPVATSESTAKQTETENNTTYRSVKEQIMCWGEY